MSAARRRRRTRVVARLGLHQDELAAVLKGLYRVFHISRDTVAKMILDRDPSIVIDSIERDPDEPTRWLVLCHKEPPPFVFTINFAVTPDGEP